MLNTNNNELEFDFQNTTWSMEFLQSKHFSMFINLIPDAIIISRENGQIFSTNKTAQKLFQYTDDEFKTLVIEDLVPIQIKNAHTDLRKFFFKNPYPRYLESRTLNLAATKKDGSTFPMESALFALKTPSEYFAVNLLRDVTKQKEEVKIISEYAYIDELTGLSNRRFLMEHLKRAIQDTKENQNQGTGLLFIDFDDFKIVNDIYGHLAGDQALKVLSNKIYNSIPDEHFMGRLGGDEFVVVIHPATDYDSLKMIANNILECFREPFEIDKKEIKITVSIGISLSGENIINHHQLLFEADKAMYRAKTQGGNCYTVYN